jgi:hypothetical protein
MILFIFYSPLYPIYNTFIAFAIKTGYTLPSPIKKSPVVRHYYIEF